MSDNQSDNSDDWSVAQPAPEPVAMGVPVGWIDEFGNVFPLGAWVRSEVREKWKPLYTTPPAQPPIDGFGGNLDSAFDVPAVPDGWVMVPREATRDMCVAAVVLNNGNAVYKNVKAEALEIEEQIYAEVYEAMIAAAPGSPPVAPAAPAVQPLTDEQIDEIWDGTFDSADPKRQLSFRQIITRAIERAHGITGDSK